MSIASRVEVDGVNVHATVLLTVSRMVWARGRCGIGGE